MRGDTAVTGESRLRRLVWQLLLLVAFGFVLAVGSALVSTPDAAFADTPTVGAPDPGDPDEGGPNNPDDGSTPPDAQPSDQQDSRYDAFKRKWQQWREDRALERERARREQAREQESPTWLTDRGYRDPSRSRSIDRNPDPNQDHDRYWDPDRDRDRNRNQDRDRNWRGKVVRDPTTGELVFDSPSLAPGETDARTGDGSEDWDPPDVKRAQPRDVDDPPSREDRQRARDRKREELARDPRPVTGLTDNLGNTIKKTAKAVESVQPWPVLNKAKSAADPVGNFVIACGTAWAATYKKCQELKNARAARERDGKVDAKTLRDSQDAVRKVDKDKVNKAVDEASRAKKAWQDASEPAQDAYRDAQKAKKAAEKDPTPHNKAAARWKQLEYERLNGIADKARKAYEKADDKAGKVGRRYVTPHGLALKERAYQARKAADQAAKEYDKAQAKARTTARKAATAGPKNTGDARRKAAEAKKAARAAWRKYNEANRAANNAELAVRNDIARTQKSLETRREKADLRNGVKPTADTKQGDNGPDTTPPDATRPPRDNGPAGGPDATGRPLPDSSGPDGRGPTNPANRPDSTRPTNPGADQSRPDGTDPRNGVTSPDVTRPDVTSPEVTRPDSTRPGGSVDTTPSDVIDTSRQPEPVDPGDDGKRRDRDKGGPRNIDPDDPSTPAKRPEGKGPKGGTDTTGKTVTPDQPVADGKKAKDGETVKEPETVKGDTKKGTPESVSTTPAGSDRDWALKKQEDLDARDTDSTRSTTSTKSTTSTTSTTSTGGSRSRRALRGLGRSSGLIETLLFGGDPLGTQATKRELATMRTNIVTSANQLKDYLNAHPKEAAELAPLLHNKKLPINNPVAMDKFLDEWDDRHDDTTGRDTRSRCDIAAELGGGTCDGGGDVRTEEQEHGNRRPSQDRHTGKNRDAEIADKKSASTPDQVQGSKSNKERHKGKNRDAEIADKKSASNDWAANPDRHTGKNRDAEIADKKSAAKPKKTAKSNSTVRTEEQEHGNRRPAAKADQPKKEDKPKKSSASSDPAAKEKREAALKKQNLPA